MMSPTPDSRRTSSPTQVSPARVYRRAPSSDQAMRRRPRHSPLIDGVLHPIRRQGLHEHLLAVGQRRHDDVGGGGRRCCRRHAHQHAIREGGEVVRRFRQGTGLLDELPAAKPRQPAVIHRGGRRLVERQRLGVGCARQRGRHDGGDGERHRPQGPPAAGSGGRPGRASPGPDSHGHVSPRRMDGPSSRLARRAPHSPQAPSPARCDGESRTRTRCRRSCAVRSSRGHR